MKSHYLFYISAILLILGVIDFPYGYYQLLRFIGLVAFGIAAYISFSTGQKIIPFVLMFLAIIFNPFIKFYLGRELWMVVDVIAGIILASWTYNFYKKQPND
jgi:hypothetical protein